MPDDSPQSTSVRKDAVSAVVELTDQELAEVSGGTFDIEQVLAVGAQSSGTGAGKVTFNPF
jgi:bacteriocin-like protein